MKRHLTHTSKHNTHFAHSIMKYGWDNLIKSIVFIGSKEECFNKEKELRNKFQIGWNEAIGGIGGDRSHKINYSKIQYKGWNYDKTGKNNPFYNKKHSQETKDKITKAKAKFIIRTIDGDFYSFRSIAKFYGVSKTTAIRWASSKEGWNLENIR